MSAADSLSTRRHVCVYCAFNQTQQLTSVTLVFTSVLTWHQSSLPFTLSLSLELKYVVGNTHKVCWRCRKSTNQLLRTQHSLFQTFQY